VEFNKRPNFSLKDTVAESINEIDTKYVMFLEHDWVFLQEIDLEKIIDVFDAHDDVRYLRFNKEKNVPSGWTNKVVEDQSKPIPLCKVDSFSNNPYIIRKEAFESWIPSAEPELGSWKHIAAVNSWEGTLYLMARYLIDRYVARQNHSRQLDDIEFIVDRKYKDLIQKVGFEDAHQEMGTYLYGGKNTGPYIKHIG